MLYHLFCVLCCRLSLINFDIEELAITASGVFCEMKQQKGSDGDENLASWVSHERCIPFKAFLITPFGLY